MVNQPGKEILFAHLASNLLRSGNLDVAIKVCAKGLKKFPTYAQAHYILARCYIRKKLNDEARAELERVLRYEPNHIKAIRDLAGLYFTNGFQDLYKEYLMQLFTLDPMNENVIQEAKKLGEYKLWSSVSSEPLPSEPVIEPHLDNEDKEEKENVFIETEKEKSDNAEPDPIFPDKIDLSQFDNVEDDFTTILHGKMEYSGQISQTKQHEEHDLADIAKDIIEETPMENITDSSQDKDQAQPSAEGLSQTDGDVMDMSTDDRPEAKPGMGTVDGDLSETDTSVAKVEQSESISNEKLSDPDITDESPTNSDEFLDEEDDTFEQPKIISQTLGEILVSQQKYVEAKAVFEALKEKQPDNKALDLKIEYLDRIIGLEKEGKS
jgi:tetratricopeptide (TPR) repeat protein